MKESKFNIFGTYEKALINNCWTPIKYISMDNVDELLNKYPRLVFIGVATKFKSEYIGIFERIPQNCFWEITKTELRTKRKNERKNIMKIIDFVDSKGVRDRRGKLSSSGFFIEVECDIENLPKMKDIFYSSSLNQYFEVQEISSKGFIIKNIGYWSKLLQHLGYEPKEIFTIVLEKIEDEDIKAKVRTSALWT